MQYLLQPSMIETNAVAPSTRAGGRRSNFSISGNEMSTCGLPDARARVDHLGQPVQRLRAEHEIDVRRARDDRRAFLARDAAADADQHVRALALQMLHAAEIVEDLLLRFLAHRAGVEEDDVGLARDRSSSPCPCAARSTSAILSESYSFIWQPKVLMYSLRGISACRPASGSRAPAR